MYLREVDVQPTSDETFENPWAQYDDSDHEPVTEEPLSGLALELFGEDPFNERDIPVDEMEISQETLAHIEEKRLKALEQMQLKQRERELEIEREMEFQRQREQEQIHSLIQASDLFSVVE